MNKRINWRHGVAIAAVLLLSAPAAVGVYRALEPTRGPWAAGLAAAGIELAYLSLALLTLRPELRQHADRVAYSAVATSITLNVLADYAARVTGGLASWPDAVRLFDPLALGLALLESAPLAGLAFALASLLHRLAEQPEAPQAPAQPAWGGSVIVATQAREMAPQPVYPAPQMVGTEEATQAVTEATKALACPACGATLTTGQYGAAKRYGRCRNCK